MDDFKIERKQIGERLLQAVMALAVLIAFVIFANGIAAKAAAPSVSVYEINYEESTITLHVDANDTILYLSNEAQKKWEYVPAYYYTSGGEKYAVMDISWVSATKNYTMSFKGNYSTEPIKVTIPKQSTNLKVTYNVYKNTVSFQNAGTSDLEWKKKDAFTWNDYDADAFSEQLDSFISNGVTLIFRKKADNGTGSSNPGERPSKEASVVIPKKTAAPTITINDEQLSIAVKKGMEYRYADDEGNPLDPSTGWISITKDENKLISTLAPEAIWDPATGANLVSPAVFTESDGDTFVYLQFRTKATTSAQMSYISTIKIPVQDAVSAATKSTITVSYTSSTTFNINIPAASSKYPYEYCIINTTQQKAGVTIDSYETLTWTKVTSTDPIGISRDTDKVNDGSLIYVRKAAYESLGNADYELASPAFQIATVKYPGDISTGGGITWLQTVAGVCETSNPEGYLTFTMYSPTKNVITKIRFMGYTSKTQYGSTLTLADGDFKSTVERNAAQSDPTANDAYIITTTLMNTSSLDKYSINKNDTSTRAMLAYITVGDSSEEYKSDADKGIGLYIHPATTVDNPSGNTAEQDYNKIKTLMTDNGYSEWSGYSYSTDKVEFTTSIVRMVNSNRYYNTGGQTTTDGYWDAAQFRIKLNFGTRYVPATGTDGNLTSSYVEVTKIKYDGVDFAPGAAGSATVPFYVEYANIESDASIGGEPIRTAVITINADVIEKNATIDDRNKATAVYIYLSNGEILKKTLTMNLKETATITGGSSSWTITEGSLTEYDTTTTTSASGVVTETKTEHVDVKITLTESEGLKNVSLLSVKWNGVSVCTNIKHENGKYTMDMNNVEINKIDVSHTTSNYLVFTFDNGFEITTGWKLTINPKTE